MEQPKKSFKLVSDKKTKQNEFNKDKKAFINIVKSFHRINPQVSNDYSLKSFSKGE